MTFNLIDQPWIPVRDLASGQVEDKSLRDAILQSHKYAAIEHNSPMVTIAIYRLVLAFLHRALQGPEDIYEAADWYRVGNFDSQKVEDYIGRWHQRFDLLHRETPFYQMPDLPLADDEMSVKPPKKPKSFRQPWDKLSSEFGSGNSNFLYQYRNRQDSFDYRPIPVSEAARRLVEFQSFALGGTIQKFVMSALQGPLVGRLVTLMTGGNLFETLSFNLVPYPKERRARDCPIWEREPVRRQELDNGAIDLGDHVVEPIRGLTSVYTWFIRSVRIYASPEGVEEVAFAAGFKMNTQPHRIEPMLCYIPTKDGGVFPLTFRSGGEVWRDYHALLPRPALSGCCSQVAEHAIKLRQQIASTSMPGMHIFGLATGENAGKIECGYCESFILPTLLIRDVDIRNYLSDRLDDIESVRSVLESVGEYQAKLLLPQEDEQNKAKQKEIRTLARQLGHTTTFLESARNRFLQLLERLPSTEEEFTSTQEQILIAWHAALRHDAIHAFESASRLSGTSASALRAFTKSKALLHSRLKHQLTKEERNLV